MAPVVSPNSATSHQEKNFEDIGQTQRSLEALEGTQV